MDNLVPMVKGWIFRTILSDMAVNHTSGHPEREQNEANKKNEVHLSLTLPPKVHSEQRVDDEGGEIDVSSVIHFLVHVEYAEDAGQDGLSRLLRSDALPDVAQQGAQAGGGGGQDSPDELRG